MGDQRQLTNMINWTSGYLIAEEKLSCTHLLTIGFGDEGASCDRRASMGSEKLDKGYTQMACETCAWVSTVFFFSHCLEALDLVLGGHGALCSWGRLPGEKTPCLWAL